MQPQATDTGRAHPWKIVHTAWRARPAQTRLLGSGSVVILPELVDAARRIHQLLLARVKRVANRADVGGEAAAGRVRLHDRPASAGDGGFLVVGVDRGFHRFLSSSEEGGL